MPASSTLDPPLPLPDRRTLSFGSLSHYAEPSYYDKCYASRRDDVSFYEALAASRPGASILEYGCGDGRITLPLSRAGHPVVGVDLSQPMLDAFAAKLTSEPPEVREQVRLVRGDMRETRLRTRFDLVLCTFNTFLHLYERSDVERFLHCVRSHLAKGGRLVFDTALPLPEELSRNPSRPYRVPRMKYPPTGQVVKYAEYFDYDPMTQVLQVTMRFEPTDGEEPWSTLLTHRQYHPREVEALLHYNGFRVVSLHPDFQVEPGRQTPCDAIAWVAERI